MSDLLEITTDHFGESKPHNHKIKHRQLEYSRISRHVKTQAFPENFLVSSVVLSSSIFPGIKDRALVGQKVSVPKHWKTDSTIIQTHI